MSNSEAIPPNTDSIPDMPSSDLLASIETEAETQEISIQEIVSEANKIRESYPQEVMEELGGLSTEYLTSDPIVLKTAGELYRLIARKAKAYFKVWCSVNGYRQKWNRHRELPKVNYKFTNIYNRYVYDVSIYTDVLRDDIKPLATNIHTSEEAILQAAYKCGFLDSLEYKSAFKAFPKVTIDIILQDHKIIERIKALAKQEELRNQIMADTSQQISYKQRTEWYQEIEQEILRIKGAI